VQNFSSDIWSAIAYQIVCVTNFEKFRADPDLLRELRATGSRYIVEGAWYDPIWGVGLGWDDPAIEDQANWKGTNWLGEALMAVREQLATDPAVDPWQDSRFQLP
jgi:ribA/ribD-fused uncharacterized protein